MNSFVWMRRKKLQLIVILFVTVLIFAFNFKLNPNESVNIFQVAYLYYYIYFHLDSDSILNEYSRDFSATRLNFQSPCQCDDVNNSNGKDEMILLHKHSNVYTIKSTTNKGLNYNLTIKDFESFTFTCDMYNVLRRGPHLKILAYSLYGKEKRYYQSIYQVIEQAKRLYPGWVLRIFHDNSIDTSIICQLKCNGTTSSHVDFCDIGNMPYDTQKTWNAKYMHVDLTYVFFRQDFNLFKRIIGTRLEWTTKTSSFFWAVSWPLNLRNQASW